MVNPLRFDPTRTGQLRMKFIRDLRRRFKHLKKEINKLLVERDIFGLAREESTFEKLLANAGEWAFLTDEAKLTEFQNWLSQETGLSIVSEQDRYWEAYVQQGYEKGAGREIAKYQEKLAKMSGVTGFESPEITAFAEGRKAGTLSGVMGAPETIEKVKLLASRTLTDLKGVSEVMAIQMRKELVDGLIQGMNPREIARGMTIRAEKGLKHAERIARTEIIRAHAEGQLDALERMGVDEVGVMVEWSSATDDRTCPLCSEMDGVVFKISEAHGLIPLHPNCRCAYMPANVGEDPKGQKRTHTSIRESIESVREQGATRFAKGKRISKKRPKASKVFDLKTSKKKQSKKATKKTSKKATKKQPPKKKQSKKKQPKKQLHRPIPSSDSDLVELEHFIY